MSTIGCQAIAHLRDLCLGAGYAANLGAVWPGEKSRQVYGGILWSTGWGEYDAGSCIPQVVAWRGGGVGMRTLNRTDADE